MLQALMSAMGLKKNYTSYDDGDGGLTRRQFARRTCDQCIGFVDGKAHPILDWSQGGAKIFADPRPVAMGQSMDIEMKFHLRDGLVHVRHRAHVVRKWAEGFSVQFEPLTADIRKNFQSVIDDFNAREFAGSQV